MRLARNSLTRLVLGALLLCAPATTGCAAPALFVAANAVDGPGGGGAAGGRNAALRGYLPEAKDFPGGWDVSSTEVLRSGSSQAASPTDNVKLVFGDPPKDCALPERLYQVQDHPSVIGTKAPDANASADAVASALSADLHSVTVEVGPAPEKDSLLQTVRGLVSRCGSFQFTKNSSYDSDFQVNGSIKPADPKLGFGDAAGLVFTFAPKISSMFGSSPSSELELGFTETVYAARVKGVSLLAISFSFKDATADSALALKLFQETAKRINS